MYIVCVWKFGGVFYIRKNLDFGGFFVFVFFNMVVVKILLCWEIEGYNYKVVVGVNDSRLFNDVCYFEKE